MDKLNDLTSAELAQIRERLSAKNKVHVCPYCEREFMPTRHGQKFCTSAHQKLWHKELPERFACEVKRMKEEFAREREQWAREREELVREIKELKKG